MSAARWLKDVGGLALYQRGPGLVERVPRRSLMSLSAPAAGLLRRLSSDDDDIMRRELLATFDEAELPAEGIDSILAKAWQLRFFNELEVLRYPHLSPSNIDGVTLLEGQEHLDKALSHGRGAIVMIGHFGANQMLMPALGHRGYTVNQLSASPTAWKEIRQDGRGSASWDQVQDRRWELEQTLPAKHIDVFGFLRPAYDCLARNEVLGVAFDGGGGSRWMPAKLGKRTMHVSTQPWQLARSTGAMVVPAVVVRHPAQKLHRVVMQPPYQVKTTDDKSADLAAGLDRFMRWFELRVRQRPDHYAPFMMLRYKVRDSDARMFFEDWA